MALDQGYAALCGGPSPHRDGARPGTGLESAPFLPGCSEEAVCGYCLFLTRRR